MQTAWKLIYTILLIFKSIGDTVLYFASLVSAAIHALLAHFLSILRHGQQFSARFIKQTRSIRSQWHVPAFHAPSFPDRWFSRLNDRINSIIHAIASHLHKLKPTPSALTTKQTKTIKPSKPKQQTIYVAPFSVRHARIAMLLSFVMGSILTVMFVVIPFILYYWILSLPSPYLLSTRDIDVTTKIYDRHGSLLYEIYAEQNRTPIPLSDIPDHVRQATIAIEDQDFYTHQGFSLRGILRAANQTLVNKRLQGGSTITQQLVKTSLLTPEIKISRKIKEVILAFWSEQIYTKDQILEMYLNQVPYGGTAWGIESASRTYFGTSVKELNLAQAALLAGLPAAPTQYSPFGNTPEAAFERQREVLRRMVEEGYITSSQATDALSEPIVFETPKIPIKAPHFVLYVKQLLEERYGTRLVERGGLRVTTTLDESIQQKAQDIVTSHVTSLSRLRVGNGAAIITNPKTGEILAMVGSKNYFDTEAEGNVNVTLSKRQPGSSIKVVTYAAALENGYTAATLIDDAPVTYNIPGSTPYKPVNYDSRFHGLTPLRYALGNSYNIPAVKTINAIGVDTMVQKARAMGINSWTDDRPYGLAVTLGAAEATILEMATVYGTLANGGVRMDPMAILEVTDYTGQVLERARPQSGTQALNPSAAWIIGDILRDNIARAAAFGSRSLLVIPDKSVSVKTGTSNDKRDNWAIGYTPSVVAAVWVGNNDNAPMDPVLTSGITGATPIWHDLMVMLLEGKQDEIPPKPEEVISIPCYYGRVEHFLKGTEPLSGRCQSMPQRTTPTPEQT